MDRIHDMIKKSLGNKQSRTLTNPILLQMYEKAWVNYRSGYSYIFHLKRLLRISQQPFSCLNFYGASPCIKYLLNQAYFEINSNSNLDPDKKSPWETNNHESLEIRGCFCRRERYNLYRLV